MKHYLSELIYPSLAKLAILAAAAGLAWWQGAPEAVQRLMPIAFGLIVVDTLTGGLVAIKEHNFQSQQILRSFLKFAVYSLAIITAALIDAAVQAGYAAVLAVLALIVYQEGTSTLENLEDCGLELPILSKYLKQWRHDA